MPSYDARPSLPLHINCRCLYVPVTKYWADASRKKGEEVLPEYPERESWESWFGKQSAQDQEDILGPNRYMLYEKGVSLSRMLRGKNNVLKTLEEVQKDLKRLNIISEDIADMLIDFKNENK